MKKIIIPSILIAVLLAVLFSFISDLLFAKGVKGGSTLTQEEMANLDTMSYKTAMEYLSAKTQHRISGFEYIKTYITSPFFWLDKIKIIFIFFVSILSGCLLLGNYCLKNKKI